MVVAGGVEGEVAEELAGGGGDDADVEVVDEHEDVGAGVGSADADVVESAVVAQGDRSGGVDAVVADAVVGSSAGAGGSGLGQQPVDDRRGAAAQRGVGPLVVVELAERVELGLEVGDRRGGWLGAEPAFEGLLEAFDLAAGGGVVRA